MTRRSYRCRAFTLVEVVIAIAIFAVCILALVALFSTGLLSSRKSGEATAIASMSSQIFDILRAANTNAAGQTIVYNFDANGQMTNATSYYSCKATFSNAATQGLTNVADTALLVVNLRFCWPAQVNPAPNPNLVSLAVPPSGP